MLPHRGGATRWPAAVSAGDIAAVLRPPQYADCGRHLSGGGAICNRPGRNRPAAETHGGGDLAAELSLPRAMIVRSCRQIPPTWRPQ
jgi:hypothetical protein